MHIFPDRSIEDGRLQQQRHNPKFTKSCGITGWAFASRFSTRSVLLAQWAPFYDGSALRLAVIDSHRD